MHCADGFLVAERSRFSPSAQVGNLGLSTPEPPPAFRPRGSPRSSRAAESVLHRYLENGSGRSPDHRDRSVSLLWVALGLILGIDIGFHDAGRWTGMIRGGLPGAVHQLYTPQFLENTTPILP